MKQSTILRRVSVAIVAVLLITMSVLSVTLAKYISGLEGDITGAAKSWVITLNNTAANNENAGSPTEITETVMTSEAFPGMAEQVYTFTVANGGECGATIDVELTNTNKPTNMTVVLKKGDTAETATAVTDNKETAVELGTSVTIKYYVVINWEFDTDEDGVADDVADTANAGDTFSFTFKVDAEQVNPNA